MRIAVCGDSHLGRTLHGYDLAPNIKRILKSFFRFCASAGVEYAVHLGDLGDKPVWSVAQQKFVVQWCNEFERAGIELRLLVGNHDIVSRKDSTSALDYLKAIRFNHVQVIDRPHREGLVSFIPFPSPGVYESDSEWLEDIKRNADGSRICFTHLNVQGAKLGETEFQYRGADFCVPEYLIKEKQPLIVNGHIHTPQSMPGIVMPGASERLNFGERDDRCEFLLFTLDKNCQVASAEVQIFKASKLKQLELDVSARGNGGHPPTNADTFIALSTNSVANRIVKVQPFVDSQSTVDWSAIEQHLYKRGAKHVAITPPISVEKRRKVKRMKTSEPPLKSARRFIRSRITDKQERLALYKLFEKVQDDC